MDPGLRWGDEKGATTRKMNFLEFPLSGPKFDDFEIERDKDTGRDIELE
jgi:hypothetical protein